jgi:serine/threonine protein kinase/ligand-binding sensor domain-containing protein
MIKEVRRLLFKVLKILIILTIVKVTVFAQQYPIRSYSTGDGLVQNTVFSLFQDSFGRIWVGTTGGVSCYDSVNFTNYTKEDGLSGVRVYSIYQESANVFLFGSEEGVTKLEFRDGKKIFTSFTEKQGLKSGNTHSILFINNNFFFAGSGGIFRYDGKIFEDVLAKNNLPPANIRSGFKDKDGNLWFGSEGKLFKLPAETSANNDIQLKLYEQKDGVAQAFIRNIYQDSKGDIWLSFYSKGIARFLGDKETNKFQYFTSEDGLPSNICYSLTMDLLGNYWIGTDRGVAKISFQRTDDLNGINKLDVLAHYNPNNGLSNKNVLPILVDREQNIWFGTHNGLDKLITEKFINYTTKDGLASNTVYCTIEDKDGDIWIGTDLGLNLLSNNKLINLSDVDSNILRERIYSLLEDNSGLIWVVQYTNISVYQKIKQENTIKLKKIKVIIQNNAEVGSVACIEKDSLGRIWIGSGSGLILYDGKELHKYSVSDGLADESINSISVINDQIWIGTNNGATLVNAPLGKPLEFKTLQTKDGLPVKTIGHIIISKNNDVWFSTEGGGVAKWDGKKFINYTVANGLSNNVVNFLFEDKNALWIATYNGVSKLEGGKFKNYNYKDGFSQKGSQTFWIMPDKYGDLWFSTNSGLTKYSPKLDYTFSVPPSLAFTAFKIGQSFLSSDLYQKLLNGDSISLSYKENTVEIDFLATSFINESKVTYQYTLEQSDKEWQSVSEGVAKYNSLAPGDYVFQVKAINSDGLSSEIKTMKFSVANPYWLKPWFIVFIGFSIVGIAYSAYRLRVRAIEAKNKRLEKVVQERTNEITEQKRQLEVKNKELNEKNSELNSKNLELLASNKRADRIFSALAEALPGTVLDEKYQLDEKIGAGGFGAVYKGTHLAMKRPIAIKVFRPSQGNDSTESLERFQLEAISASRINHPNVVAILDSGISTEGIAYLVMELLEGHSLKEELNKKKYLSVGRAMEILLPVCDVLSKAHEAGIIHRDVKPDNIFLHQSDKGEQVKLIDFGIAKWKEPTEGVNIKVLTVTGGIIGTPAYMAPERFEGKCYPKSDVFSLGIILYEMLGGKVPFQEELANFYSWIKIFLSQEPEIITTLNPLIPEPLAKEIMKSISKDPNNRPTAKEMAEKLLLAIDIDFLFTTDNLSLLSSELHKKLNIWEELDTAHRLSLEERKILEAETLNLPK